MAKQKKANTVISEANSINDIDLKAFLFAEDIITDQKNRHSLIKVFDQLRPTKLPFRMLFRIFISVIAKEGDYEVEVLMHDPDGNVSTLLKETMHREGHGIQNLLIVNGTEFQKEGAYNFMFNVDGKLIGSNVLQLSIREDIQE